MSNLLESKAFDNFIKARCTEILQEDAELKKLNKQILQVESDLLETLNEEQRKIYNELDVCRENLIDYLQCFIYRTCVLYRIGVK